MRKITLLLGLVLLCSGLWSQTYIDMRKPIRMVYGGDTLIFSFSGDTVILYSNHKNFRVQDLLKVKQLVLADSVVTKIMPDTLVNPAFVREYVAEHGGGADPHITDSTIYIIEPTNGNYFDFRLSPYENGYYDHYWTGVNTTKTYQTYYDTTNFAFNITDQNGEKFSIGLNDQFDGLFRIVSEYQNVLAADSIGLKITNNQHYDLWEDNNVVTKKYVSSNSWLNHLFFQYTSNYVPAVAQNVYTKILPGFTIIEVSFITFAGDTATIINPGDYYLTFNVTLNGGVGDDYTLQIRKNNISIKSIRQTTSGGTNYHSMSTQYYFEDLVAGDDISFWITNTANSGDPTMNPIDCYIEKKHD